MPGLVQLGCSSASSSISEFGERGEYRSVDGWVPWPRLSRSLPGQDGRAIEAIHFGSVCKLLESHELESSGISAAKIAVRDPFIYVFAHTHRDQNPFRSKRAT